MVKNPLAMQEMQGTQVQSMGREDSLEEGMVVHSSILVFLPEKSHRQRSLAGYNPQGCKELDTTEYVCSTYARSTK